MAETGLSLVVSKEMLANLQKADNAITNLATKSEQAKNRIVAAFTEMGQRGVGAFINKLNEAQNKIASLNNIRIQGADFSQFTNNTTQAIDAINKLSEAVSKVSKGSAMKPSEASNKTVFSRINEEVPQVIKNIHSVETAMGKILVGDKTYSNSALTKINAEIDTAMKKLGEVNKMLQFYAKGEGKKAIGFADTTSYQKEAKELMNIIDLLQRQRQSIIANSQLRMKVAQQQEAQANRYIAMENERRERIQANAKLESDLARKRTNDAKKNYEEQYKAYERMFDEIERRERKLAQQQAKNDSRMRKKDYQRYISTQDTYNHAINVSSRAKTLNQELRAIKALEHARGNLNKTDSQYEAKLLRLNAAIRQHKQNIDRATQSSKNLQGSHRGLMNISEQLQRRLALVFSVSQITGYISKLISVRGEFELQQRSLQAILQDRDEANKLWQQTVDLAVRSPFRVKELVTYTKQLAAYRIETEKLHDTTKMLSDVAAGLGVDMQRLILAFGQVKAANYLRGTELRQFSEAGINILGELATYFTELEGVAVSVGEVFERVSKRMVTFGDVEEVFKRLTSAGGTFYRMQEIQSNTLRGMISNLKDSIDLMLNDIGQSNEGVIKFMVNLTKGLVENWHSLANMLKIVVAGFAMYKVNALLASKAVKDFALSVGIFTNTTLPKQLTMLQLLSVGWAKFTVSVKAAGVALKTFIASNIWVLAITALATAIYELVTWNKELNEQLGELNNRRDEELSQINNLTRAYQRLNKEQQKEGANSNAIFSEKLKKLKELQNLMGDARLSIPITSEPITQENIDDIFRETENLLRFARDWGYDLGKEIAKGMSSAEGWFDIFGENLLSDLKDLDDATSKVTGAMTYGLDKVVRSLQAAYPNLTKDAQDYLEVIEKGRRNDETEEAWLERKVKLLKNIYKSYRVDKPKELKEVEQELLRIATQRKEVAYELDKVISNFTKAYGVTDFSHLSQEQKVLLKTEIDKAFEQQQLSDQTKRFAAHYMANKLKIPVEIITPEDTGNGLLDWQTRYNTFIKGLTTKSLSAIRDVTQTREALRKTIKEQVEQQQDIIDAYNVKGQKAYSTKEMKEAEKKIKDLTQAYVWLGGALDTLNKKGKKDEQIKILNNRMSLIKEIHEEYKKLNKTLSETDAKEQILTSYAESFKDAFKDTGISLTTQVFNDKALQDLKHKSQEVGSIISKDALDKIEELKKSGTYIRDTTDDYVEFLKKWEQAILVAKDVEGKGKGYTIGFGEYGEYKDTGEKIKAGDTIDYATAVERLNNIVLPKYKDSLNDILNKNKELVLTQEQYNALLDLTYQGGAGATKKLLERAYDIDAGVAYIEEISGKINEEMGPGFAARFGKAFVEEFKKVETVYERIAMLLKVSNLTIDGDILSKYYKGMQARSDARAQMFSDQLEVSKLLEKSMSKISDVDFTNVEGVVATLKQLMPIAQKEGKEAMLALQREIDKWEAQIGLDAKIKEDKALLDQIEEMFSGYEISLELQKLNIPNDLAEQLFNVDTFTLPELKDAIIKLKPKFEGKDMLDEWDKLMKRIDDMEVKATRERLKTYTKYLVKAQSERVKIKLEELRKIAEVEKESAFTDTQRQEILEALRNETQKNLDKLTWDEFKDSDLYLKVFEDLEYVSDVALTRVKDKLDLMRSSLNNLSVEDLRIITKEMQKIDEELIQRSPFKALTSNLKDYILFSKERNEIEQKWIDSQSKEDVLKAQTDDSQIRIAQLQQEYETSVKTKGVLNEESIAIKRKLDFEKQILDNNLKQLVAQGKITQEYADQLREGEQNKKGVVEGLKGAMNDINDGYNAFNGLMDTIQSMFGEFSEGFQSFLDGVSGVVDGLGTIEGGLSQILDGKIFSGVINTITGVFKSIGAIFGIGLGDNRKQKKIEREIVLVEDLQKQYEKLNKTINKAYSISTLEINQKAMSKNIDTQIRSYEKMIKLEDDKKNTDKEKIKEWEDTIEELREKRKKLNDEILSGLGGVTEQEYRSATRAFVDAWTSAFQETGNGLEGLQQHFADFFNNILSEQATLHIAQNMLAPFYRQVESALNDSRLSSSEAKALKDKFTEIAPQINDFLSTFFENIGGFVDGSKYELSGLQRGIQGITEDQADVIASYLNSMRFFVADSNTKLSLLVDSFTNPESANPMLSELRSQSEMLRTIRDMFSSVIGRGDSTHSGAYLKVVM